MEKRNYVKPKFLCYDLKTTSIIAGSKTETYTGTQFQGILDECLQLRGSVTNAQVITMINSYGTNGKLCMHSFWDPDDQNDPEECKDENFTKGNNVEVSYNSTTQLFTVYFSSTCSKPITDTDGGSNPRN